jgi:hypothetical protein
MQSHYRSILRSRRAFGDCNAGTDVEGGFMRNNEWILLPLFIRIFASSFIVRSQPGRSGWCENGADLNVSSGVGSVTQTRSSSPQCTIMSTSRVEDTRTISEPNTYIRLKTEAFIAQSSGGGVRGEANSVHLDEVWVGVEDGPKWTPTEVSTWGINGHFGASSR